MIDVVEQVIERHPKVKNEGIPEGHTLEVAQGIVFNVVPQILPFR